MPGTADKINVTLIDTDHELIKNYFNILKISIPSSLSCFQFLAINA
jgi:hypothetical protein